MTFVFWLSVGMIAYSYLGYPLILIFVGKAMSPNKGARSAVDTAAFVNEDGLPSVTVIFAAYNEESCVKARVENIFDSSYPGDKITALIGSDGSTDETNMILEGLRSDRIKTSIFPINRGKMSVLNDLIAQASDEILIMTDANTQFDRNTIPNLVRHFGDPQVGAVCGELHLVDNDSGSNRDNFYWRYEQFLKRSEADRGALLGANGAIYAIRKSLFKPLPANTIVDDFQIVMNVSRSGASVRYDPEAQAVEDIAPNLAAEHKRRIRIGTGNYQALVASRWALNPFRGWRFFAFLSHKVLRWFAPHFMVAALLVNLFLLDEILYRWAFVLQIAFYLIAWFGIRNMRKGHVVGFAVSFIAFFVSMNLALLQGFFRFLFTNTTGTWQRTDR